MADLCLICHKKSHQHACMVCNGRMHIDCFIAYIANTNDMAKCPQCNNATLCLKTHYMTRKSHVTIQNLNESWNHVHRHCIDNTLVITQESVSDLINFFKFIQKHKYGVVYVPYLLQLTKRIYHEVLCNHLMQYHEEYPLFSDIYYDTFKKTSNTNPRGSHSTGGISNEE